jgi:hypothetical protein
VADERALLLDPTRKAVLTQATRLASLAQIGGNRVTAPLSGRLGHDTMAYHIALCASPSDLGTWAKPFFVEACGHDGSGDKEGPHQAAPP